MFFVGQKLMTHNIHQPKNLLLFKKNSVYDSLISKESERLIRTQRYVREVLITPVFITSTSDSIDVKVRVLDSWSLIPNGSLSGSQSSIKLAERNLFGFGHQITGNLENRFSPKEQSIFGTYTVNNIKNSFISIE